MRLQSQVWVYYSVSIVHGLIIPSPSRLTSNSTQLGINSLSNVTSLEAPPLRQGLYMTYRYDLTIPLRYDEIFANSFKLISELSNLNKDTPIKNTMAIFGAEFDSTLLFFPLSNVQVSDATRGLYQVAVELQQFELNHPFSAYKLLASIQIGSRPIAIFDFSPSDVSQTMTSSNHTSLGILNTSETITELPSDTSSSSGLSAKGSMADKGFATSVIDPRLKIYYEFDGKGLGATNLFVAIMDAMATAAQYAGDADFEYIVGTGKDNKERVDILVRSDVAKPAFTWTLLRRALATIYLGINFGMSRANPQARWEGLAFIVEYDKRIVGDGSINRYSETLPHGAATSR